MSNRTEHIIARINELASISETESGITRRFGTPAAVEAGNKVLEWMREAGLEARVDAIGNIRGRWLSEDPGARTLVIASHLDTVVDAGRWDGPLGVLTGLDILQNFVRRGRKLPFHVELIAFSDEEGVRFHTTYLGSQVVAGSFEPVTLQRKDENGVSVAEAIRAMGGDPGRLAEEAIPPDRWLGYFEVHIEQGPVLYERQIPVAAVIAIAGQIRAEVVFTGLAGHAGTVPMEMRRDALCAAAEFILEAEKHALGAGIVTTVGMLRIANPASNTIAGEVTCSVDLRSADPALLSQVHAKLKTICASIGVRRGLSTRWTDIQTSPPVACDPRMKALLRQCIEAAGYESLELVSGAGHDAVPVSAVSPVCMLFVRCYKGISHNPQEQVEKADLAAALAIAETFIDKLTEIL